jgi:hypothetical protein
MKFMIDTALPHLAKLLTLSELPTVALSMIESFCNALPVLINPVMLMAEPTLIYVLTDSDEPK